MPEKIVTFPGAGPDVTGIPGPAGDIEMLQCTECQQMAPRGRPLVHDVACISGIDTR
jgi:hypothetical protein